ncbi:MAG: cryptochrome/photolyase family protein [Bacteroidales bacterium]
MTDKQPIAIFWFRRDLRIFDNPALFHALTSGLKVLPVFIFDKNILDKLYKDDKRVHFIFQAIENLNILLKPYKSAIKLFYGNPKEIFGEILLDYNIRMVFANHDYEPYAIARDMGIEKFLKEKGIGFQTFKDQVVFEKNDITKVSGEPYTVFTPYSKKWLEKLYQDKNYLYNWNSEDYLHNFIEAENNNSIQLSDIVFSGDSLVFEKFQINRTILSHYGDTRDFPALDTTSKAGIHLRFGTISIRQLVASALEINPVWLNELIWREFFMQILFHFPHVQDHPFKPKYQFIKWINNENDFEAWKNGLTGYPLVDAGMRELNETGFMHNRVRMVTSSFLIKHLLVNWQWGEAYFAEKLLDFDLSANNGNWQWAAGTGCDAAPYFRIFNPTTQAEKFDKENIYISKWVPEYASSNYCRPIIEHSFARNRCLEAYKASL